jgi:hypothetical protein
MRKIRIKRKVWTIIENIFAIIALFLFFWVDWKLAVGLALYEIQMWIALTSEIDERLEKQKEVSER